MASSTAAPRVLVVRSAGTNCDGETAQAFELAGGSCEFLHVNRLLENPGLIRDYAILVFPGGFSYGDDISAGRILAQQISSRLMDDIRKFVASGRPVAGICNGFQVLVKTDLLPGKVEGVDGHPATLAHNTSGRFTCRWVDVKAVAESCCIWTRGMGGAGGRGAEFALPIAHGEGRFVPQTDSSMSVWKSRGQIALRYAGANPNGSTDAVAGICDETGLIFGLMPHPERHVRAGQHPAWSALGKDVDEEGPGLQMFRNAVECVR